MDSLWKPDKNRLIAVLKGEMPDRVPNFEVLYEERNVNAILGRNVGTTMSASRGASDKDAFVPPPMDVNDFLEILDFTGQDTLVQESLWAPMKYRDEKGNLHEIADGYVKSWEDFEKIVLPDWELDFEPRKRYLEEYVKAVKGTNVGVTYLTGTFFQYCYQFLIGFQDFCTMIYTDRELLEKCLDLAMDYYIKITEIALDAGIDILFIADDVAYKTGTFIRPDQFKDLWLPRAQKLVKMGKQAGVPVMFHSCGNLTDILDSVICELGADCLYPVEPYNMDIFEVKPKYMDKFAIGGNLDIAGPFAFGTPDEVYKIASEMIERLKPGGRYIFASNHSITDDIPPENLRAALKALREHGVY